MSKKFSVNWNCDHVLKWNEEFSKNCAFLKIHIYSKTKLNDILEQL
jgi:hypothetical protein